MNTNTAIIAPLRIKRPVLASRVKPRYIGQEVFKQIFKMACEMKRGEEEKQQREEMKIANDSIYNLVQEVIRVREKNLACEECFRLDPHPVLDPTDGYPAPYVIKSEMFLIAGEWCYHNIGLVKRAGYTAESAYISIDSFQWGQEEQKWKWSQHVREICHCDEEFVAVLMECYEQYVKIIRPVKGHRGWNIYGMKHV